MKRYVLAGLILSASLSGCATTHIFQVVPPETVGGRQDAELESYFGAAAKPEQMDCNGNGVARIYVKQSFWRSLLSTITLGNYQDTQLRFECHPGPNMGAGEFGVGEFGAGKFGAGEFGAGEFGADESGADESGTGEFGSQTRSEPSPIPETSAREASVQEVNDAG